jgi:hypothetical protein
MRMSMKWDNATMHIRYKNVSRGMKCQDYHRNLSQNLDIEQVGLAIAIQACVREVLGSNLGRDARYHDWELSLFS